jgi:hypothetical protein
MARERLEELIDGRLDSFSPTPPLLSSAQSAWSGFPLERNAHHVGGAESIVFPHTELVIVAAGAICMKYRAPSGDKRKTSMGRHSDSVTLSHFADRPNAAAGLVVHPGGGERA